MAHTRRESGPLQILPTSSPSSFSFVSSRSVRRRRVFSSSSSSCCWYILNDVWLPPRHCLWRYLHGNQLHYSYRSSNIKRVVGILSNELILNSCKFFCRRGSPPHTTSLVPFVLLLETGATVVQLPPEQLASAHATQTKLTRPLFQTLGSGNCLAQQSLKGERNKQYRLAPSSSLIIDE